MPHVTALARERLGPIGAWIGGPEHTADSADLQRRELRRLDELDFYGSVWTGETVGGRDVYAQLGVWLAATGRIAVGSGIANVWARAPQAAQAAAATLAEAYPERFIHGVGIGHAMQAQQVGGDYRTPITAMRDYLRRMDEEHAQSPFAVPPFPRVIAAVGPRMLDLAAEYADGAHPYFVPVEHTVEARRRLGREALLIPEQSVLVEPDDTTLAAYRQRIAIGTTIGHYRKNLLKFGLTEHDLDTANDRFFHRVAVAGSPEHVAQRIVEHLQAGADHVLVNPFGTLPSVVDQLARLIPVLRESI
ncbi:MAG TPA: TIGR03620 family F420-dependent LLM class oxidoreductase [Mycobacterium sp.]|jgi:probable F420-dependent oxidoreductase|nr:TIGR03620 family F420-dependent LLM class oxidoreductase [Mycobacterium sp.]